MKIAIVGAAGRMGRKLVGLAPDAGLEVVAQVDVAEGYDRAWPKETEGVIDFSHHAGVPGFVAQAAEQGIPYVIGTTGLSPDEQRSVDAAARKVRVGRGGNDARGVSLLVERVRRAATVLGRE